MPNEVFDPTRASTSAEFELGSILFESGSGKGFMYVRADGALTAGAVVVIESGGDADPIHEDDNRGPVGVAQSSIANDSYGWVQVSGYCAAVRVASNFVDGARIYSTGTDGQLNDTPGSGNVEVLGMRLAARTSAGNTTGYISFPSTAS